MEGRQCICEPNKHSPAIAIAHKESVVLTSFNRLSSASAVKEQAAEVAQVSRTSSVFAAASASDIRARLTARPYAHGAANSVRPGSEKTVTLILLPSRVARPISKSSWTGSPIRMVGESDFGMKRTRPELWLALPRLSAVKNIYA